MTVAVDRPHGAATETVRPARQPLEMFAAAVAALIPIAFVTGLDAPAWSLRVAILLLVVAVGLPILLSQARDPRPLAARAALVFLLAGAVSAGLSQNRTTAVFGLYNQGTGLLFMASLAAIWAIGRRLRPEARPQLERALLAGIFVNMGVGLLAVVFDLSRVSPDLVDSSGRASGLAGNPVHLAAFAVMGLALVVPRFVRSPARWAPAVAVLVAVTQLSGTRGALIVMAAVVAWAGRRHGLRIAAMLAVLVVLGLAAGTALGTSAASATTRAAAGGGWQARPSTWMSAGHSLTQHPLLGVGPGQFRTATSPYRSVSIGRSEGAERLFTDAHNILAEYATTTGLLGVGALLVWLLAASWTARGWLLVGALGVLAIHLFEPQSVATTPLAFLALGASGSSGAIPGPGRGKHVLPLMRILAIAGALVLGLVFLLGEYETKQGLQDLTPAPAQQANRLLPHWSWPATRLARVWLFQGITHHRDQADFQLSRSWRLAAVQRDRTDPGLWDDLAEYDETLGRNTDAQIEYGTALHLNPTSVRAMTGLARLARARCDLNEERTWRERARAMAPPPPKVSGATLQPPPAACSGSSHA